MCAASFTTGFIGELMPPMPIISGEDATLPMNKSITAELQEQWAILSEVWGTPMVQWKGVAVAAWMEAAIGKIVNINIAHKFIILKSPKLIYHKVIFSCGSKWYLQFYSLFECIYDINSKGHII